MSEIFDSLFSVLISINVPPLKSTPKFKPLKKINDKDNITNIKEIKLSFL